MAHRVRESMRDLFPETTGPMGGEGRTVEADETFIGGKERNKYKSRRNPKNVGGMGKEIVFGLIGPKGLFFDPQARDCWRLSASSIKSTTTRKTTQQLASMEGKVNGTETPGTNNQQDCTISYSRRL